MSNLPPRGLPVGNLYRSAGDGAGVGRVTPERAAVAVHAATVNAGEHVRGVAGEKQPVVQARGDFLGLDFKGQRVQGLIGHFVDAHDMSITKKRGRVKSICYVTGE